MCARVSNQAQVGPVIQLNACCAGLIWSYVVRGSPLHAWLVPHSMQTPQAPARMTLSLPHTEQMMPMKTLPSATATRSGELLVPLPFPSTLPPFAGLDDLFVITSITCLSPVRAKSVTGRFRAFFS